MVSSYIKDGQERRSNCGHSPAVKDGLLSCDGSSAREPNSLDRLGHEAWLEGADVGGDMDLPPACECRSESTPQWEGF